MLAQCQIKKQQQQVSDRLGDRIGDPKIVHGRGKGFSVLHCVHTCFGLHSPPLKGGRRLLPQVKWPICKADHLSLLSAEVMNAWTHTSPPNIRLHDVAGCLTSKGKVYLYLNLMSTKCVSKIIYVKLLSKKEVENQTDTHRWNKSQQFFFFGGGEVREIVSLQRNILRN